MSSLALLFKKISQPNPAEIDPEDSYHSIDAKANKPHNKPEQDDIQNTMGPSLLKTNIMQSDSVQHTKYAGRLVTYEDWMKADACNPLDPDKPSNRIKKAKRKNSISQSTDEDDIRAEGEEVEDNEQEDVDDDDDNEGEDDDEIELDAQAHDNDEDDPSSRAQSPVSSSHSQDEGNQEGNSNTESIPIDSKERQGQPSDLIQQLQVSAKADIEKAKAVKEQLAMYDRILAIRIGIQKSLVATNKLVETKSEVETAQQEGQDDSAKEQAQIAVEELLAISSKIGALRAIFMEPIDGEPPRKRHKGNQEIKQGQKNNLKECLQEADQLDKRLSPYLSTTVRKWSTKINSTTALNSKKFDSTSKQLNAMDQLDKIWSSKDEKEKLIMRSRTSRQQHNPSTNKTNNNSSRLPCPLVFEDRDFYLSLLKDVVDSAARNQDMTEDSINNTNYRAHRVHRENVDPKASKGRKIRYDTHEKLISVMVPTHNELWTDEQKDELFASLFGFGFENDDKINKDDQFLLSKSDGFKLF